MRVKIYQINAEKDENAKRFSPFSYAEEHGGVNSDMYKQVYFGDLDTDDLEGVFAKLNESDKPPLYKGTSLSVSDVVEVFDSEDSNASMLILLDIKNLIILILHSAKRWMEKRQYILHRTIHRLSLICISMITKISAPLSAV